MEYSIRAERADDPAEVAAIADVVSAAFGSPGEARLVEAIRASPHYQRDASLVAVRDGEEVDEAGEVLGHVMLSHVGLVDEAQRLVRQVLSLSPLAVAPPHQGRGIGSALVEAAVAVADRRGEPVVVLEGSPRYYGRLGFEPSTPHGITIDVPDWAPPEASQVRRLSHYDPAVRGTVAYPPAFDVVADA